jgi:hypothetical protein
MKLLNICEQFKSKPDQTNFDTSKPDQPGQVAQLKIEAMDNCHGFICEHLDSRAGERPMCKKAMMPVFDVGLCPFRHFGPMSPACGSYKN